MLYHPCSCNTMLKVFYVYLYIFIKKSFLVITSLLYCCAKSWWYLVQSVGLLLNNGETVVTGQWEVWGFFFFSEQQRRVWKKWGLKEYGKVTQPKPKLWLKGEPRCRWSAPGFYRSSSKERISGHFLSPQILHHSYIKTFWKRSLDREQSEFIHCIFFYFKRIDQHKFKVDWHVQKCKAFWSHWPLPSVTDGLILSIG